MRALSVLGVLCLIIFLSCSSESTTYFNLTTTATPTEGGAITPSSGEFEQGEQVEIYAQSNEHWAFERWEGDHGGIQNPIVITMDSDKDIAAVFAERTYPLAITIEGQGQVDERIVQEKSADYPAGTLVELTAVPDEGWEFSHWEGDLEGDENPVEISIEGETEVTAVFTIDMHLLTVNIEGEGSVQKQVVQAKSTEYPEGTIVELTANPDNGWRFVEWKGDLSGDENPKQITIDTEREVTAVFEERDYPLTIHITGQGSVSEEIVQSKASDYPYGTVVELTASPAGGWEFSHWEGDLDGDENPAQITIEGETEVTAVFTGVEYPLTIHIEGEGSVSEQVVQGKATEYPEGTVVELTSDPEENWIFSQWQGDLEGDENPAEITIDEPKEVTAVFLQTYSLSTHTDPEEGGSITPQAGDYVRDTSFDVEAIPATDGWRFTNWEGDFSGTTNPFSLTMNGNKTLTAHFERREFELEIATEGQGSVEPELISGTETADGYLYESVVSLTATPGDDWNFLRWEGDVESDETTIEIEIDSDKTVTAVFIEFEGGDGTEGDPFRVATLEQLQKVGEYLDRHFIQVADIDASPTIGWNPEFEFIPIGRWMDEEDNEPFTGSYNGDSFEINNLSIINRDGISGVVTGLFGYIKDGIVENVSLSIENMGSEIEDWSSDYNTIGGLVGLNDGSIKEIFIEGNINCDYFLICGGVIGINYGLIDESHARVDFDGEGRIGGLVGKNYGAILSSYTSADVTIELALAAGLVARNYGTIYESFASGNVSSTGALGSTAGGLVAINDGEIKNSYAHGDICGGGEAGGLVAVNGETGIITNSYSSGYVNYECVDDLTETIGPGAFVGINDGTIIDSYWDQEVSYINPFFYGDGIIDNLNGLSTSQMTGTSAKDNMPEFDWDDIWLTITSGYPILWWQVE
ncbi:MAG: hypothetical protein JJU13_07155 [Balneolaceae bacterium]|nr:hypothetical protein [Balneolaceae bacterium]